SSALPIPSRMANTTSIATIDPLVPHLVKHLQYPPITSMFVAIRRRSRNDDPRVHALPVSRPVRIVDRVQRHRLDPTPVGRIIRHPGSHPASNLRPLVDNL